MKMNKLFGAAVLAVASVVSHSAFADLITSDSFTHANHPSLNTSNVGGDPVTIAATSGCASSDYCTLTELINGGSLSAGGLTFGNFNLDFDFGYGDGLDTDNVWVRVFDFGGAVMLDYDFAPLGFGGPLPTLLSGDASGIIDLSYSVVSDSSVDIFAAWLWDMIGAGTQDADYELQFDMTLFDGDDELAYLYLYSLLENNQVIDSAADDLAIFAALNSLNVWNSISAISYEGLNLFYIGDQMFFTEVTQVPAPFTVLLFGFGLAALGLRKRVR